MSDQNLHSLSNPTIPTSLSILSKNVNTRKDRVQFVVTQFVYHWVKKVCLKQIGGEGERAFVDS